MDQCAHNADDYCCKEGKYQLEHDRRVCFPKS